MSALQAQEQRRILRQDNTVEGAFSMHKQHAEKGKKNSNQKNKGNKDGSKQKKYQPCSHCKKTTHLEKFCWWRPDAICGKCKQLGHVAKVCKSKKDAQTQQAQVADDVDVQEEQAFMAFCLSIDDDESEVQEEHVFAGFCFSINGAGDLWLIDSGCTHHMCKDDSLFSTLDDTYKSRVKVGNGQYIKVEGSGAITIQTQSGIKVISDVLYIPKISQNLLSIGQMLEKDYAFEFRNRKCTVFNPAGEKMFSVTMKNRSFLINWEQTAEHAFTTTILSNSDLWHKRFGHFNQRSLMEMQQKELIEDMPTINHVDQICETCQFGKQARLPFPKNQALRATQKLHLIHTDVCGPMKIASLSGNNYFILFIDDYTRLCWVYFIKFKSEVFTVFKEFKALVENQCNLTIKILRSDNGAEYSSSQFVDFCKATGIEHQFTVPYTPQQNGVSERKNRTVMEMARCLLKEKEMPNKFWAEAVNTSVYLLNRLPTRALVNKTPYEAWFGVKPSVGHIRIFGSICFYQVPKPKRSKLDCKAQKGIFIGYGTSTKGYRIFCLQTEKIIVSRDVKFDEAAFFDWKNLNPLQHDFFLKNSLDNQSHNDDLTADFFSNDNVDDLPVRGVRSLADIYQSCNAAVLIEPNGYEEAHKSLAWRSAMDEELQMINKNETWQLVERPKDRRVIGVKWVFKTKLNPDGSISKHKARLVVKGYAQQYGVDYQETFAPVARYDTIRLIIALAAHNSWQIHQLDVKSAFLNGFLVEEIFIEQPDGYLVPGKEDHVYLLKKALYGLKQAPRAWYDRLDSHLLQLDFYRSQSEATLYVKSCGENSLIVSIYVDDMLVTGSNFELIQQFKDEMRCCFEMTDLGIMKYFLGMEVTQLSCGIFICQQKYASDVLRRFKMEECKPVGTPMATNLKLSKDDDTSKVDGSMYRSLVGSLLYLTASRPDILFVVNVLSRFMSSPKETHFSAAKRVLRYIKGTADLGIFFPKSANESLSLIGYSDSDWGGCVDDSRSTTGYLFSLGAGYFTWSSKKQETTAQSTAEAEYIAAASAVNHAIWLRKLLEDLGFEQTEPTRIMCDNMSAVSMAKNPVFHGRTKHIKIKFHFLREVQQSNEVLLVHCSSEEQLSNIFTKSLPKERFEALRKNIGVCHQNAMEEC